MQIAAEYEKKYQEQIRSRDAKLRKAEQLVQKIKKDAKEKEKEAIVKAMTAAAKNAEKKLQKRDEQLAKVGDTFSFCGAMLAETPMCWSLKMGLIEKMSKPFQLENARFSMWVAVYLPDTPHLTHVHESSVISGSYYASAFNGSSPIVFTDPRGGQVRRTASSGPSALRRGVGPNHMHHSS